jgi:hypothetical protein
VTIFDGADADPVPTLFVAVTANVYAVPFDLLTNPPKESPITAGSSFSCPFTSAKMIGNA